MPGLDSTIMMLSKLLRPYSFRGKARLLHYLCSRDGECEALVFGYRTKLDLSDLIQRSIYLGVFEPEESAHVTSYLKRGMTFVDVGANVGYYTLMAASLVGQDGLVIAFEPSPYAFGRLQETIDSNSISQVRAICAGLAEQAGEIDLFVPIQSGNYTPTMVPNGGGRAVRVPIETLDDYLRRNAIETVDLMKIDVEGFEPNILMGAKSYLERHKIKALLCEFNEDWLNANKSSGDSLFRLISSFGYKPINPRRELRFQNIMFTVN
jgi:FkbM family methyltransferase